MKNIVVILGLLAALGAPQLSQAKQFHTKHYKHKHHRGLKRSKHLKEFLGKMKKHAQADAPIPAAVDLSKLVSPPENQGSCGSCWDFSLTKALRSSLMISGKDPGTLAFNYLLNNCGPGPKQWGCGGGDFDAGQSFLDGHGPWLESQDPYKGYETRCKSGLPVSGTALKMVQVGGQKPSFQQLASAINQKHMLSIDVAVCGSWGSYSDGIFDENSCGAGSIDHMINMVGYDCQTSKDAQGNCQFDAKGQPVNKDGFLIVMNNWGEDWGENGYMRTRWGMDAVADTAMYFEVEEPAPPTPPTPPTPPVPPTPPNGVPTAAWIILGALVLGVGGYLLYKALAKPTARRVQRA